MKSSLKRCSACYFFGQCVSTGGCDDFVPMTQEREDEQSKRTVESDRREFYWAWLDYIDENI